MQNNVPEWIQIAQPIAEIVLAAVAVIISIIALFQTKKQTQLSNKHQLFDCRLDKYSLIKELVLTFSRVRGTINKRVNLEVNIRFILSSLMENDALRDVLWVVEKPTSESALNTIHEKFRWLGKLSEELQFLFKDDDIQIITKFIDSYKNLLLWLQRYNSHSVLTEGTDFGIDYKEKAKTKVIEISSEMEQQLQTINNKHILDNLAKQIKLK